MVRSEVREFLQQPRVACMSVIDDNGYPHSVPVAFLLDGDDVVITSVRGTRKEAYIRSNPKGALVIGGDFTDAAGYLLKGTYRIEEDPGFKWIERTINHYNPGDPERIERNLAEYTRKDMIVMRLRVQRIIKVYDGPDVSS
jgi:nitroimidazol reductase NimA-like FMN-containing flavoprotein (pyridoxamine 5'-phosphate oxidase superfamily)